jgi:hypothetical protein
MTDRELVELAAKAIGLQYEWHVGCGDAVHLTAPDAGALYWNPLVDDRDAFRLAVKLEFGVATLRRPKIGEHYACAGRYGEFREDITDDPCAATRRAIVKAAAALTTSLPMKEHT